MPFPPDSRVLGLLSVFDDPLGLANRYSAPSSCEGRRYVHRAHAGDLDVTVWTHSGTAWVCLRGLLGRRAARALVTVLMSTDVSGIVLNAVELTLALGKRRDTASHAVRHLELRRVFRRRGRARGRRSLRGSGVARRSARPTRGHECVALATPSTRGAATRSCARSSRNADAWEPHPMTSSTGSTGWLPSPVGREDTESRRQPCQSRNSQSRNRSRHHRP